MKYKICILSNFGPPHTGGSEVVLENISNELIATYNYDITIYAYNYKFNSIYNNINLIPYKILSTDKYLFDQLNQFDHIFIYSDSFWGLPIILKNINQIKPKISIALVGMYFLSENKEYFDLFKHNINRFNVITHSKYVDYEKCINENIPVNIIPNGINLFEFKNNDINFRDKYGIKEKNIILCVSNFFYGKNQEKLADIGKELKKVRSDFIFVIVYNTIEYTYADLFFKRCENNFIKNKVNYKFLKDLPREDVIAAFKCSNVFCFPTGKEVSPLVILESIAAKLPWISQDVGNLVDLKGGIIIKNNELDYKGYKKMNNDTIKKFSDNIDKILEYERYKEALIEIGQKEIKKINWKNIVPLYDNIFKR
jgi:glycosyltransferase involved in cell wall biosynthesis